MYAHVSPASGYRTLLKRAYSISWLWMALLASLLFFVLAAVRLANPSMEPASGAATYLPEQSNVVRTVLSYVSHWDEKTDPLVPAGEGVVVKRSNYDGLLIDGKRYYYSLAPHMSYDPVSRGDATRFNIVWISPEDVAVPVVIYTLE